MSCAARRGMREEGMQSVCGRGAPSGRMENGSSICTPISSMPVVPHGDERLRSRADALNSANR